MFGKSQPQPKCVLDVIALEFEVLIDAKRLIDAEVAKRSTAELENAKSRLSAMAASLGVSLGSLFGIAPEKKPRKKRKETELKLYVNPDNPDQIYKGKGKRPEWLQEKIDAGRDIAEFHMDTRKRLDLVEAR